MGEETREEYEARSKAVLEAILKTKDTIDVGEMLHSLAGIGWDAALVYDDNGHWAMPNGGHSSVSEEISDWEGGYFAEARMWKDTPREAIIFAVELALELECEHDWVDARNEVIQSGEICTKCHTLRPGNATSEE